MANPQHLYTSITSQIIADLERGIRPWNRPWTLQNPTGTDLPLRSIKEPYSGINILILWMTTVARDYTQPVWMTFRQAKLLGAQVRKGERSTEIVYGKRYTKTVTNDDGTEGEETRTFLKTYRVFNVDQIDNLPDGFIPPIPDIIPISERLPELDTFFANTGADIRIGGDKAFYKKSGDQGFIRIPHFQTFDAPQSYYATLAHELIHWTSHPSRLDRQGAKAPFASEEYAFEELVAELGSAFLCAELKLTPTLPTDHADYIGSWLKVLKDDNRAIFKAAALAQKAVEFLKSSATSEARSR